MLPIKKPAPKELVFYLSVLEAVLPFGESRKRHLQYRKPILNELFCIAQSFAQVHSAHFIAIKKPKQNALVFYSSVLEAGLEPARPFRPLDFKLDLQLM